MKRFASICICILFVTSILAGSVFASGLPGVTDVNTRNTVDILSTCYITDSQNTLQGSYIWHVPKEVTVHSAYSGSGYLLITLYSQTAVTLRVNNVLVSMIANNNNYRVYRTETLNLDIFLMSFSGTSTSYSIVDITGVQNRITDLGSYSSAGFRFAGQTSVPNSSSSSVFNSSYSTLALYNTTTKTSGYAGTFTILYPITNWDVDFITARFYVTTAWAQPNPQSDSQLPSFTITRRFETPVVEWSIVQASTLESVAPLPVYSESVSASSLSYFPADGSLCYDVTVDLRNTNITRSNPYVGLVVSLRPSAYNSSSNGNYFTYCLRVNAMRTGYFSEDPAQDALFLSYYLSFLDSEISKIITNDNANWHQFTDTFTSYMSDIISIISGSNSSVAGAKEDIDNAEAIEQDAVDLAQDALNDSIIGNEVPVDVMTGLTFVGSISTFLSSGSGLVILLCLVVIPLSVGLISKLLNGGD